MSYSSQRKAFPKFNHAGKVASKPLAGWLNEERSTAPPQDDSVAMGDGLTPYERDFFYTPKPRALDGRVTYLRPKPQPRL